MLLKILLVCCSSESITQENSIRFADGNYGLHQGYVEILKGGTWFKISHAKWDYRNDIVVCKQLGFADVGKRPSK